MSRAMQRKRCDHSIPAPALLCNMTQQQKTGPNAEEIEQNENIARLTRLYNCEDRSCSFTTCWPAPPDGNHIHLTHLHLNTWTAAMAGVNDP